MKQRKKKLKAVDVIWVLSVITVVGGWVIHPYFFLLGTVCMFAPVIAGLISNKTGYVCNTTCGRGSFLIKIWKKVSLKRRMPRFFISNWFKIMAIVFLMGMFTTNVVTNLLLSDKVFLDRLTLFSQSVGFMISLTGVIALILGFIYKPKTWCVFCPMATIGKTLGKKIHN